jgi:hypothetical protein
MIALYDHIQELKAELRHCRMTHRERADAENELAQVIAEHNALESEFDGAFEMLQSGGG